MVWLFILRLSARTLSGLVGKLDSLPLSLHPPSVSTGIFSIGVFFNKVRRSTPWPFVKIFEYSAPLLGVPFDFLMYPTFLDGVLKWYGENCGRFSSDLVWDSVPIFWRYPSFFWVASLLQPPCPCGDLLGFLSLVSLCQRGSKILGGTAPLLQVMSWEVFSLTSCFVFLQQISYPRALFPALQLDYFGGLVSSPLSRGGDN